MSSAIKNVHPTMQNAIISLFISVPSQLTRANEKYIQAVSVSVILQKSSSMRAMICPIFSKSSNRSKS